MRRIYPQILQAEQAIQELRSEIAKNEVTSRDQHVELNDASHQIQSLRNSLGSVERQKSVRRQSIRASRHTTHELREEIATSSREEQRLADELRICLEEGLRDSALLEEAAARRESMLTQVDRTEQTIQSTANEGAGAQESCSGILFSLKKTEKEVESLQDELASADWHSIRQRRFMAAEESEASWQYENTCEVKDVNAESRQRVDALEDCRERLEKRLQELEDAKREGDGLELQLGQAREQGASLQKALEDLHQLVADRNVVLERVLGEHSALRSTLEESEDQARLAQEEANELTSHKDETHAKCREAKEELETAEIRMRDAESVLEREHKETESQVLSASRHRDTVHEQVAKLNENITSNLQQRLRGLEEENKNLQNKISFLEDDCAKISTENAELEQTIEEVKKKPNCVIS